MSVLPVRCDSGISSSTTTKIIAPAAKAERVGQDGLHAEDRQRRPTPRRSVPRYRRAWPSRKLFRRRMPSRRSGMETAVPSGKFCRPMPMARAIAPARRGRGETRGHRAEGHAHRQPLGDVVQGDGQHQQDASAASAVLMPSACVGRQPGMQVRQQLVDHARGKRRPAGSRSPPAASRERPDSSAISIAGASSDQKLAAIITPAAKPSMASSTRRLMVLKTKTRPAPSAVTAQVNSVPARLEGCGSVRTASRSTEIPPQ